MDLKQLQYFVTCAQTGSVSEAAKILYSTQPSVSKVVKALEDSLGMQLFERLPRGIRLTPQGSQVYRYACKIVGEVTKLEAMADHGMTKWLRISANPSSWFATHFVDFYNENYDRNYHFQIYTAGVRTVMERVRDYLDDVGFVYILERQKEDFFYELSRNDRNYHFQIYTAGVRTVMERVRDYLDDVGFVYILERQKEDFFYELSRNRMEFIPLHETEAIVYPGGKSFLYGTEKESLSYEELDGVRLVQNYQDEFFDIGAAENKESFSWKGLDISVITNSDYIMESEELDGVRLVQNYQDEFFDIGAAENKESFSWKGLDISVITNSDYIMERLLKNSDVANISGSYLSENKKDTLPGIPLKMEGSRVIFGYVRHRGEEMDSSLKEFICFLEERIGSGK